ncbi:SET domain-containing protein-lysine N-methyltransferase [Aquabacterium sp.]|uniref:SET domain-containing protein n=1 Tax=Aquabacterium sp. TaxID=1872578 RepID=UPI00198E2AE0|nr:SET domain-containing protein-lysine N-methyltransferase [Aquabacterium sp.]MBC7700491.1 SET domain-containing protein-lysine N-methyltransferase [Aquabacterium sp.]
MPTLRPLPAEPDPNADQASPAAKGQAADPQKFAVEVKPSAIDGQGVFALQAVAARRKIGEIRGESVSTAEAFKRAKAADKSTGRVFMIAVSNARSVDATASADPLRFANHSCVPNMVFKVQQGRVAFYALRDIAVGEELTVAYGPTHHAGRLACRCGAPGCAGSL